MAAVVAFRPSVQADEPAADQPTVVLAVGAAGEPAFEREFQEQADNWKKICAQAGAKCVIVGRGTDVQPGDAGNDHDQLKQLLATEPKAGVGELWLVLIGHGTFDGKEAKFNLRGPDLSAAELAEWLKPFQRSLAIIDTSAASAPFLAKLSGPKRVVVTATRSGFEENFARFGKFFAEAMADPKSDLDKDGQVSLLEGYLSAARRTAEFYKTEGRLATEHALLDDNGDGLGTPADWFHGVRATKRARDNAELDGARARRFCLVRSAAEQQLPPAVRARRDELELEVEKLRDTKSKLPEAEYYRRLEKLLLDLAALYEGT
jgi:hypothetical protein